MSNAESDTIAAMLQTLEDVSDQVRIALADTQSFTRTAEGWE
jgi:hypothetical protein